MQNTQFGSKNKIAENMRETFFYRHIKVVLCKKWINNQLILEKWEQFEIAKNGHEAEAIAYTTYSVWIKK